MQLGYESTEQLLNKAKQIAGLNLLDVANLLEKPIPENLNKNKGWIGSLIEQYLNVINNNQAMQDFPELGIELKTIPISKENKPLETTFVCFAPLNRNIGITWQGSYLKKKLSKVLWIPIEGERTIPLSKRKIGQPILWEPNEEQENLLQRDWEELMDYIILGKTKMINAKIGVVLQLRPKAKNSKVLTSAIDEQGNKFLANPLGFYLRKEFTQQIINNFLEK